MESIPTYTAVIKTLIGSYAPGLITSIYGNAASGKTTCCLLASIACAKNKGKVIYVDTEGSFSSDRLRQLYFGELSEILDNILLFSPKSFEEQHELIPKIGQLCRNEKIQLVIIDTIGNHYRNVLNDDHKLVNSMLVVQLRAISHMATDHNKVILLTNQVYSGVDNNDRIKMVGGTLVSKMSKCIIELHKKDDRRFATLIKYKRGENDEDANVGKKNEFYISEKGLLLVDPMYGKI